MATEPTKSDTAVGPPEQDITPAERQALLRETLQSLQEAFSAPDGEEEAGTTTELNQNPADAVPEQTAAPQ